MSADIADHLLFEILLAQVLERFLDPCLRARDADDHAPKRRRLDLVEVAEEHRDLDFRELADHAGQHGVVG